MDRFFFVVLLFSFCFLKAQDTIVKRNGTKILSKVAEVNPHNIRYRRLDLPDGPLYLLEKEQINVVIYANGIRDTFASYVPPLNLNEYGKPVDLTIQPSGKYYYYKQLRIAEPDMHAVVRQLKDPSLNRLIKSTENMKFMQEVCFLASIPVFISGAYVYAKNQPFRARRGRFGVSSSAQQQGQKRGTVLMIAALVMDAVSISLIFDRRRHNHLLVNEYNRKIALAQP